jgi:hypothetical protein
VTAASAPRLTGGFVASLLLHGGVVAMLVVFAAPRMSTPSPPLYRVQLIAAPAGDRAAGVVTPPENASCRKACSGAGVEDSAEDQASDKRQEQAGTRLEGSHARSAAQRPPSLQSRRRRRRRRVAARLGAREPTSRTSIRRASSSVPGVSAEHLARSPSPIPDKPDPIDAASPTYVS